MAEVVTQFAGAVIGDDGVRYRAQACASRREDGLWQGWIEFIPIGRGTPVRTPRETTQPNRRNAIYWATGLTSVYLEGALDRALHPLVVRHARPAYPVFDAPAPDLINRRSSRREAILNPFSAYEKGETRLRQQLGALGAWHLVNIILAYDLSAQSVTTLTQLPAAALVELIVTAVRESELARRD